MSAIDKTARVLEVLSNDLTYMPSHEQRKLKSAFWLRFNDNPVCEAGDISVSIIQRVASEDRLEKWWSQPGFKEWFRNQEEFRERVESMAHLALDTLMEVLVSDDPRLSSSKVAAAKLLLEVGRKLPSRNITPEKYIDQKVGEMDKKQLDAYIAKQLASLPKE